MPSFVKSYSLLGSFVFLILVPPKVAFIENNFGSSTCALLFTITLASFQVIVPYCFIILAGYWKSP